MIAIAQRMGGFGNILLLCSHVICHMSYSVIFSKVKCDKLKLYTIKPRTQLI